MPETQQQAFLPTSCRDRSRSKRPSLSTLRRAPSLHLPPPRAADCAIASKPHATIVPERGAERPRRYRTPASTGPPGQGPFLVRLAPTRRRAWAQRRGSILRQATSRRKIGLQSQVWKSLRIVVPPNCSRDPLPLLPAAEAAA